MIKGVTVFSKKTAELFQMNTNMMVLLPLETLVMKIYVSMLSLILDGKYMDTMVIFYILTKTVFKRKFERIYRKNNLLITKSSSGI